MANVSSVNDEDDNRIARRQTDQSVPVPIEFAAAALGTRPRNPMFPADAVLAAGTRQPATSNAGIR